MKKARNVKHTNDARIAKRVGGKQVTDVLDTLSTNGGIRCKVKYAQFAFLKCVVSDVFPLS